MNKADKELFDSLPDTISADTKILRKKKGKMHKTVKIDDDKEYSLEELDTMQPGLDIPAAEENIPKVMRAGANILDIPASHSRVVIDAMLDKEKGVATELGKHVAGYFEEGLTQSEKAPRGTDLLEKSGMVDGETHPWVKAGAGFAAEIATDPMTFGMGKAAKLLTSPLRSGARKLLKKPLTRQTKKALANNMTESMTKEGVDLDILSERMVRDDLTQHLHNPDKLKEKLSGSKKIKITDTPAGPDIRMDRAFNDKGLIGRYSREIDNVVDSLVDPKTMTNTQSLKTNIMQKFRNLDISPVSGVNYAENLGKIDDIITKHVAKTDYLDVGELLMLKRNMGKQLRDRLFYQSPEASVALEKEILLETVRAIDDRIKDLLTGSKIPVGNTSMDAAQFYQVKNNQISQYIMLDKLLEKDLLKGLKQPDAYQMAAEVGAWGGTFGSMGLVAEIASGGGGYGLMGMAGGLAFPIARSTGNMVSKSFPTTSVRGMETLANVPEMGLRSLPQAGRMMDRGSGEVFIPDTGREPQSVGPMGVAPMNENLRQTNNLPSLLSGMTLPRSTQGLLANKELVMAKVAQEVPMMLGQVEDVIMNFPEKLDQIVPMLMQAMPEKFDDDKYGRFDDKIVDPMMQEKARRDIFRDARLSTKEKQRLVDQINLDGTLSTEEYK